MEHGGAEATHEPVDFPGAGFVTDDADDPGGAPGAPHEPEPAAARPRRRVAFAAPEPADAVRRLVMAANRAANSRGPGGPTGPPDTRSRTPGTLSGLTKTH